MAVPKKKVSRSRRDRKRYSSAHELDVVTVSHCPQCNSPVRPHRICSCGYYKEKSVIQLKKPKNTETPAKA